MLRRGAGRRRPGFPVASCPVADEREVIEWCPTLRGGGLGEPVSVEMLTRDVNAMRARWRAAAVLPTGAAKASRLHELRFLMDVFAAFPGSELVEG